MTYLFRSDRGDTVELDFPMGECPTEVSFDGVVLRRVWVCNAIIPPHMMAAGSKLSSEDACDRQAAFLKSDRWRTERQRIDEMGGTVRTGSETES